MPQKAVSHCFTVVSSSLGVLPCGAVRFVLGLLGFVCFGVRVGCVLFSVFRLWFVLFPGIPCADQIPVEVPRTALTSGKGQSLFSLLRLQPR